MGFFTKNAPVPEASGVLAPLSTERIHASLVGAGWNCEIEEDGMVIGAWEAGVIMFQPNGNNGEVLVVRGVWRARLASEEQGKALELANDINRETVWPKVYVGRDEEGFVRVNTETNVDYEFGLTDEQLRQHLLCAVSATNSTFDSFNEAYPEEWEQVNPND